MTRVDLHPEDLFDQLRTGDLRDDQRERLHNHCEHCSACAFELQLIESANVEPTDVDHAVAARAMERMLSTDEMIDEVRDKTINKVRAPVRSHGVFRAAALVVAGVLVGGSVSAAALTGSSPFLLVDLITAWVTPAAKQQDRSATPLATRNRKPRALRNIQTAVVEPTVIEAIEPAPIVETVPPTSLPTPIATPPRASTAIALSATAPTAVAGSDPATWFFRAASHARAEGDYQEALALYGVLQREFAGSEAEVVARVALGRLWLGQLDDAAEALNAFNSYLNARPMGPLAEEARSGRIGALRKLGRKFEADAAMQELLAHHPNSLYATTTTLPAP